MPKRKKYLKLPSGYGSIRFLGKNRRLPYAVHPPAKDRDELGHYIRPAALCYVPDWYTGFAVLSAYHAGRYVRGLEVEISREVSQSDADLDAFCLRVLKDRGMVAQSAGCTFQQAYDQFMAWKYGEDAPKKLSASSKYGCQQGWSFLSGIGGEPLDGITVDRLQNIVNSCDKKKATRENIVKLAKQVYKFALSREMCTKNPAQYLVVPDGRENTHGVPFGDKDIERLWKDVDGADHIAEMILIMCHAGYRINAWADIKVNLSKGTLFGGNKTTAGKDLVTPIHSDVLPLVERRMKRNGGDLLGEPVKVFRERFKEYCLKHGLGEHTPHDTKHTFSRLCEKYGVRENDRKRMLGHAVGNITNDVYGHREVDELRLEIEKIHTKSQSV